MSADAPVRIRRRRSAPLTTAKPAKRPAAPRAAPGPAAVEAAINPGGAAAVGIAPPGFRRPRLKLSSVWNAGSQVGLGFLCWVALAGIVYTFHPDDVTARTVFFGLMFGALFFTLTPLIRVISLQFAHSRLYKEAVGAHAARQAFMIAAFIVLNAVLQLQRAWSGLTALLLFGVFAIVEIVALARR